MSRIHDKSLLIVDDDSSILIQLQHLFALEGFAVTCASSGEEAKVKLEESSFSAVVTDIRMGDGDGIFLLKFIRRRYPTVPVLMMTALPVSMVELIEYGATHIFPKPFNWPEMLAVVKKLN
jgi:DNA-binding response OmpR family regulator